MAKPVIEDMKLIFYIAQKDVKTYFFKGPNLTFGIFLPVVLYLAFSINRTIGLTFILPG